MNDSILSAILVAVGVLVAIGLICALILVIAAKFFAVKVDEKEQNIRACLPGANCGACGFTGCENTTRNYDYKGIPTCAGAKLFYGGDGACSSGCLGYGDCAKVCPSNAIYNNNGVACVDPEKCTGCGLCTKACPNFVIRLVPTTATAVVACSNKDKGAAAVKECKASCIGCKKCENICPADAIKVEDNFAHIDYTKCVHCNACTETCPRHAIKSVEFSQAQ